MTKSIPVVFGVNQVVPNPPVATRSPDHIILSKEDLGNILDLLTTLTSHVKDMVHKSHTGHLHILQQRIEYLLSEIYNPRKDQPNA